MATISTLNLSVSVTGGGAQVQFVPPGFPFVNATAPLAGPEPFVLAANGNVLTVPTGALYLLIQPPAASTNAKKLKGVDGDTGVTIHPTNPMLLSLPVGAVSVDLYSAGIETITVLWF